jgi:N-acyl-phosphatidylethanolamine-hydrolysing phospholipase D
MVSRLATGQGSSPLRTVLASRPALVALRPAISSATIIRMSSTAAIQVSKEAPSFQVPAFYRTSPPPHHTSAEPLKSGFQSPWPSTGPHSFLKFLRGRLFDWNEVPLPSSDKLPVVKQATFDNQEAVGEKIKFTWLGHAGCHVQIPVPGSSKPVTVLTDPVLSQRCSPFQWFGPARFTKACTTVTEMASSSAPAAWPDVVVLSHNHYVR